MWDDQQMVYDEDEMFAGCSLACGLEWTTKFTQRGQTALYDRATAHFDTLWLDEEFTRFEPGDEQNAGRLPQRRDLL